MLTGLCFVFFQDIVIWFSSQGSKSHLHVDTVDNINCMIYGKKNWFLVDLVSPVHFYVIIFLLEVILINLIDVPFDGLVSVV